MDRSGRRIGSRPGQGMTLDGCGYRRSCYGSDGPGYGDRCGWSRAIRGWGDRCRPVRSSGCGQPYGTGSGLPPSNGSAVVVKHDGMYSTEVLQHRRNHLSEPHVGYADFRAALDPAPAAKRLNRLLHAEIAREALPGVLRRRWLSADGPSCRRTSHTPCTRQRAEASRSTGIVTL